MNRFLRILSFAALVMGATGVSAQLKSGQEKIFPLNSGWKYCETGVVTVSALQHTGARWQNVSLPHTWNAFDAVDPVPGYRRGAGWYEKIVQRPKAPGDARFLLVFDGVNTKAEIYVNNKLAGSHVGGYTGFEFDVTPFIGNGSSFVVDVRADNSFDADIIPSQKSDFFIYGGICRNVWMKIVPPVYIRSARISTPHVSAESAETRASIEIVNTTRQQEKATVLAMIEDPSGKIVAASASSVSPDGIPTDIQLPPVVNPVLWSPAHPALYRATFSIRQGRNTTHSVTYRFGYRWFEFREHGAFYLNGARLLLRGTQRHEEFAGLGNALPDSLQWADMKRVKEMGANFVRLAHYPQAPAVYEACDSLGIIVWDELPWCRGGLGGAAWRTNTRRLLAEMINQHYNHPSIVFWSLGNELYWLPEVPGGDNIDSLRAFFSILNDDAHRMDSTRLTATRKFTGGEDIPDVFSPSIWMGWYSGSYSQYEKAITDASKKVKHLLHVEYGGDSHMGRHSENPVTSDGMLVPDVWDTVSRPVKVKNVSTSSDWNENYLVNLIDWHLHVSEKLDWFAGNAQWILKDFGTPLRPENPIPYINEKGAFDRGGNPKDIYYVYKSYWTEKPEFCYIESHTWKERSGPRGVPRQVKVFSNCSRVELILNGISLGSHSRSIDSFPACGLHWNVQFAEGKNSLMAVGYSGLNPVASDSISVEYSFHRSGEADHLDFSTEPTASGTILVTAIAVDQNGRHCLDYGKRIFFAATGAGSIVTDYGTPTRSSIIEMANGRASIEVVPSPSGPTILEVRNYDFKGSFFTIAQKKR